MSSPTSPAAPKAAPGIDANSTAAQYARAKSHRDAKGARDAKEKEKMLGLMRDAGLKDPKTVVERLNERKRGRFEREWLWVMAFFTWIL